MTVLVSTARRAPRFRREVAALLVDEIRDLFQSLGQDGPIQLKEITYDAQAFGNFVVLISVDRLELRIIRGSMWGELLVPGDSPEWHDLDKILNALQIALPPSGTDALESLAIIARLVLKSAPQIHQHFAQST